MDFVERCSLMAATIFAGDLARATGPLHVDSDLNNAAEFAVDLADRVRAAVADATLKKAGAVEPDAMTKWLLSVVQADGEGLTSLYDDIVHGMGLKHERSYMVDLVLAVARLKHPTLTF